ncbi:beta strand repeat-containing protein [Photobacterium halotolerans]|uniref:beta strand repeat-containing protein n=1 Tax=Photobacterium halotolerans TaxID=265726 RepID=UPI0006978FE4|nr:Ig-like domain-containing protein [Photobacterium halotolerans]
MKNNICRYFTLWLSIFLMTLTLAGCGGEGSGLPSQKENNTSAVDKGGKTVRNLEIIPSANTAEAGSSLSFTVNAIHADGDKKEVTQDAQCTSSDESVATISGKGMIQAIAAGETTISCSYAGVSGGSIVITVTGGHTVSQLQITPGQTSAAAGTQVQFTALAYYHDGSREDVTSQTTWNTTDASTVEVDANGMASAKASGSATVTGQFEGVNSNQAAVTVTTATLSSIHLSPATASLVQGTQQQFTATGHFSDGSTQDLTAQVTWNSDNTAAATISASGLAEGVAAGSSGITASFGGTTSAPVNLTVTAATVDSVQVTPANLSLAKGTSHPYTAIAHFDNNTSQDVSAQATWSSSDTAVATVSGTGVVSTLATGSAVITASFGGTVSNNANLTVTEATVLSVTIAPETASIANGTTQQFTATAKFSDGSILDVTDQVSWKSGDTSVATLSATGLAHALAEGSTVVTAHYQGVDSAEIPLSVTPATVSTIAVSPGAASIANGTTQQFTATATFSDASTQEITHLVNWVSSDTSVASINPSGLAQSLAMGTTQITASYQGQTSPAVPLEVTAATVTSLAITPSTATIANGLTQQFTATATFTDASTQDVTDLVSWVSSDTSVATITADGLAQGVSEGSATISANYEGSSDTATLTVGPAELLRVRIESDHSGSLAIELLGSDIFTVSTHAYYSDGTKLQVDNSNVTYHVSAASLLAVSTEGVVNLLAGVLTDVLITSTADMSGTDVDSENAIIINCLATVPGVLSVCTVNSVEKSDLEM